MFENFLLASGASDFKPERRKALLIHSLGVEGQRVFSSLLLTSDAAQSDSLRDQFVEGVASQHLHERLLLEGSTLSFCRAVALASQVEQANEDIREFASGNVQRISGHSRLALNDHRGTRTRHPSSRDDAPCVPLVPKRACSTTAANLPRICAHTTPSHGYRSGSRQPPIQRLRLNNSTRSLASYAYATSSSASCVGGPCVSTSGPTTQEQKAPDRYRDYM
ncbi:hypothetical protein HPB49_026219 [Dermacentor silvarum]|nr:hypothetical protein HPB49_026219 [Dermacentor silvarum]